MKSSKIVLDTLSKEQLDFIEAELGVTAWEIRGMDDDAIDALYDKVCDIEVEETLASEDERNGEYFDREKMAEGIVTAVGNALYPTEDEVDGVEAAERAAG